MASVSPYTACFACRARPALAECRYFSKTVPMLTPALPHLAKYKTETSVETMETKSSFRLEKSRAAYTRHAVEKRRRDHREPPLLGKVRTPNSVPISSRTCAPIASRLSPMLYTDSSLRFASIIAARSPRSLSERRISHIVSVCRDPIPADSPASGIRQLRIPIDDVDYADLLIHLPSACRFIHQALSEGGVVLVHCEQGLSRSAAVVAAYCG